MTRWGLIRLLIVPMNKYIIESVLKTSFSILLSVWWWFRNTAICILPWSSHEAYQVIEKHRLGYQRKLFWHCFFLVWLISNIGVVLLFLHKDLVIYILCMNAFSQKKYIYIYILCTKRYIYIYMLSLSNQQISHHWSCWCHGEEVRRDQRKLTEKLEPFHENEKYGIAEPLFLLLPHRRC